jgi:hypothetical protein
MVGVRSISTIPPYPRLWTRLSCVRPTVPFHKNWVRGRHPGRDLLWRGTRNQSSVLVRSRNLVLLGGMYFIAKHSINPLRDFQCGLALVLLYTSSIQDHRVPTDVFLPPVFPTSWKTTMSWPMCARANTLKFRLLIACSKSRSSETALNGSYLRNERIVMMQHVLLCITL